MSQKDFAKAMGTEFRTLQDYEYGKTQPRFDFLKKLIDTFNVDPTFLFDDSSAIHSPPKNLKQIAGVHLSPQETNSLVSQNEFVSVSPSQSSPPSDPSSYYIISKLALHAQAGGEMSFWI